MLKWVIEDWEKNKHLLEKKIRKTNQYKFTYKWFVRNIAKIILHFEKPKIYEIDDGYYQGTLLYLLVDKDIYQPKQYDYLTTFVDYGSCSGCDTLMQIQDGDPYKEYDEIPDDNQTKEYMTLCLHIVQRMKYFNESEE